MPNKALHRTALASHFCEFASQILSQKHATRPAAELHVRLNMKIYNVLIFSFFFAASPLVTAESEENIVNSEQVSKSCNNVLQSESSEGHTYLPKEGYVPNEETAIKIAVAVWEPIYGVKKIAQEKPYKATLQNGIWSVRGSLKSGWVGGVAEIEICKSTAQIIRLSHGK